MNADNPMILCRSYCNSTFQLVHGARRTNESCKHGHCRTGCNLRPRTPKCPATRRRAAQYSRHAPGFHMRNEPAAAGTNDPSAARWRGHNSRQPISACARATRPCSRRNSRGSRYLLRCALPRSRHVSRLRRPPGHSGAVSRRRRYPAAAAIACWHGCAARQYGCDARRGGGRAWRGDGRRIQAGAGVGGRRGGCGRGPGGCWAEG
jgi:hypothetical protein